MKAVIPAAGRGTRLGSATEYIPKPMVKVNGAPILQYILGEITEIQYISEIIIVVGYKQDRIVDFVGGTYSRIPVRYAYQDEPNGLGDAIAQAAPLIDEPFIVRLGDEIFERPMHRPVRFLKQRDVEGVLVVDEVPIDKVGKYAEVRHNDTGTVSRTIESPSDPQGTTVETGYYAFTADYANLAETVDPDPDTGEVELQDVTNKFIKRGNVVETVTLDGWRVNINTKDDIKEAESRF